MLLHASYPLCRLLLSPCINGSTFAAPSPGGQSSVMHTITITAFSTMIYLIVTCYTIFTNCMSKPAQSALTLPSCFCSLAYLRPINTTCLQVLGQIFYQMPGQTCIHLVSDRTLRWIPPFLMSGQTHNQVSGLVCNRLLSYQVPGQACIHLVLTSTCKWLPLPPVSGVTHIQLPGQVCKWIPTAQLCSGLPPYHMLGQTYNHLLGSTCKHPVAVPVRSCLPL